MITIFINEKCYNIDKNFSLLKILENYLSDLEGIAVAINYNVIPRSLWDKTYLNDNDHILIIKATRGG